MFHRVSTAVQMFCIVLFCFIFLAHFTHVQASNATPTLTATPNLTATSNFTGASSANSSPFPATVSLASISNKTVPVHSSTPAPTFKPQKTTPKQVEKDTGRKFDGLSFFGGIILGAVICVLLLFSVKYYQAKKRSYHSL